MATDNTKDTISKDDVRTMKKDLKNARANSVFGKTPDFIAQSPVIINKNPVAQDLTNKFNAAAPVAVLKNQSDMPLPLTSQPEVLKENKSMARFANGATNNIIPVPKVPVPNHQPKNTIANPSTKSGPSIAPSKIEPEKLEKLKILEKTPPETPKNDKRKPDKEPVVVSKIDIADEERQRTKFMEDVEKWAQIEEDSNQRT